MPVFSCNRGKSLQAASLDAVVLKGHRFKLRMGFSSLPQPHWCSLLLTAACIAVGAVLFLSHCRSRPEGTVGNKTTRHSRRTELTHCAAETIRRCPAMLRTAAVMSTRPCGTIRRCVRASV